MQKNLILLLFLVVALGIVSGCDRVDDLPDAKKAETQAKTETPEEAPAPPDGCSSEFRALFDQAVVELPGEGEGDVVIITDPLCWHCRLAHKLMSEYPGLYGRVRLSFFPRKSFIGSDMAAWILEDAAATDRIRAMVDYAYSDLKQPKTSDLMEARMLVLVQFTQVFPDLLEGTTMEELYVRFQSAHEAHVLESAMLARAAQLPGTPILVAGEHVVLGFGPGPWLKALEEKSICK
jgi:hypothetical protein